MTSRWTRPGRRAVAVATLALLAALPGAAQEARPDGAAMAGMCFSCHGVGGGGAGTIPALSGRPEGELVSRLTAYRDGTEAGTIMQRLMSGYSDTEIAALAAALTQQEQ